MERAWSIRAYEKGDENGIFELMKAVYPEKKYDREKWMIGLQITMVRLWGNIRLFL
jgi:hypothetical protein